MDNLTLKKLLAKPRHETQATRRSLLDRLKDWHDDTSWREFFETYWRLIYATARRAGLGDDEAQDVIQETVVSVAKSIPEFKYDPTVCSFKGWLMALTRRRIADRFRQRAREFQLATEEPNPGRSTALTDRVPDPRSLDWEAVWDQEWMANLLARALERVKRKANPRAFEAFYLYVVRDQAASQVAQTLGINIARVYLAKHRVAALVKQELRYLENKKF